MIDPPEEFFCLHRNIGEGQPVGIDNEIFCGLGTIRLE